ncbi:hypothetical protein EVAR_94811_1 [Eumeta japonica]|uniref:Uncharacterized protein n=1 Tax=Eumeta variegata TaxID=151549 RepID=A0A4C1UIJ3_EUMVA|nr:hypothetical protein EVAR_94811_1 [Eumeta japonica]
MRQSVPRRSARTFRTHPYRIACRVHIRGSANTVLTGTGLIPGTFGAPRWAHRLVHLPSHCDLGKRDHVATCFLFPISRERVTVKNPKFGGPMPLDETLLATP